MGQFITETISDKRQKISIPKEKEELLHHVYQLAGKQCGTLLPQQPHLCNSTWINQIPCVVSSCSFHSRKPDCREFDFLYDFCWIDNHQIITSSISWIRVVF